MIRSSHVSVLFSSAAVAVATLLACACSGSSVTSIGGGDVDGGGMSSGTSGSMTSGSVGADGASSVDGAAPDGAMNVDAGIVVNELPAPQCNDLKQEATTVTPTANPADPPPQVPITTITPGLYVLVSITDYGGNTLIQPATDSKTTAVFTATRQYYFSESTGTQAQVLTLDWEIKSNRLVRRVLCAAMPAQVGTMYDYRIDAAADGFIDYVPSQSSGRMQAFHYARKN